MQLTVNVKETHRKYGQLFCRQFKNDKKNKTKPFYNLILQFHNQTERIYLKVNVPLISKFIFIHNVILNPQSRTFFK